MKKLISVLLTAVILCGLVPMTVCGAGPKEPVINSQMPDCYGEMGGSSLMLFTDASSQDGGTLEYQWYVSDVAEMACIRAIDGATGTSYTVPQILGVKWYCYAVWNISSGLRSAPVYSRLIRVEYDEPVQYLVEIQQTPNKVVYTSGECLDLTGLRVRVYTPDGFFDSLDGDKLEITKSPLVTVGEQKIKVAYGDAYDMFIVTVKEAPHTHAFGSWMTTTQPTCTEPGIKARECDCGYTERQEVPAAGHKWDSGKVTKEPAVGVEGVKTFTCTVCKATKTEPVAALPEKTTEATETTAPETTEPETTAPETRQTEATAGSEKNHTGLGKTNSGSKGQTEPGSKADPTEPGAVLHQPFTREEKSSGLPWWAILLIAVAAAGIGAGVCALVLRRRRR